MSIHLAMATDPKVAEEAPEVNEKIKDVKEKEFGLNSPSTETSSLQGRTKNPPPPIYIEEGIEGHHNAPVQSARDIVTEILHAKDDPTLNPWTFRVWFLGNIPLNAKEANHSDMS